MNYDDFYDNDNNNNNFSLEPFISKISDHGIEIVDTSTINLPDSSY